MTQESPRRKTRRFGCLKIIGAFAVVILVTALLTAWWVKHNVYAAQFSPTHLNASEQQALEAKMAQLEQWGSSATPPAGTLQPEAYEEDDSRREITITEKELNAILAKRPELAERVAIDLSDDLVSVTFLIPLEEDTPLLGGTTIRVRAGATIRFEGGKPVALVRGVSIGGVPIPEAWWGDIKDKDLVSEFRDDTGFWDFFSEGVADVQVREGHVWLKLKE